MTDFNQVINILKNNDLLLRDLIDVHFHRLGNSSYGKINLLGIYPIINKIIQNNKNDLILVLPAKKEIAYLSSLFGALTFPLVVPITISKFGINYGILAALLISSLWFIAMLRTSEMPH